MAGVRKNWQRKKETYLLAVDKVVKYLTSK
jgi:hypothetical protein